MSQTSIHSEHQPLPIQELNSVFALPSKGRVLIEANAGTGKTYTIQGLFLRLMVEHGLRADQILVVTFTRMATHELRSRITARLQDALDVLIHSDAQPDEPFLQEFTSWVVDRDSAVRRLRSALQDSSQFSIFTIHGFCQNILRDHPSHSVVGPEFEVIESDSSLTEVIEDWWRSFHDRAAGSEAGVFEASILQRFAKNATELEKHVKPYLELRSVARLDPGLSAFDPAAYLEEFFQVRKDMVEARKRDPDGVEALMRKWGAARHVDSRLRDLMPMFETLALPPQNKKNELKLKYLKDVEEAHPFYDHVPRYLSLFAELGKYHSWLLLKTATEISERYDSRRVRSRELRYHDLLELAWNSINSSNDAGLARNLRTVWPFALVDEFQDTDPLQFELFNTIYPEKGEPAAGSRAEPGGLFMIGDPKQSIYSFRGADIFTYLTARSSVPEAALYTLRRNFRSRGTLIEAVNRLMHRDSFMSKSIEYAPSQMGKSLPPFTIDGQEAKPIRITDVKTPEKANKNKVLTNVRVELARQVAELLKAIGKGEVRLGGEPLKASDIAILSRTNREVLAVQKELSKWGVSSVTLSKTSVYASHEARVMAWLLEALLDPMDAKARQNVLATGLFGWNLQTTSEKELDSESLELAERLRSLRDVCRRHGPVAMVERILIEHGGLTAWSGHASAERSISNLRQIAEALEDSRSTGPTSVSGMLHVLLRKIHDADSSTEDGESKLETDENLVRVLTIHKSKGLEFPIVFCPDLWQSGSSKAPQGFLRYFDPDQEVLILDHHEEDAAMRNQAEKAAKTETLMESVRTAYVALTRASLQCHLLISDYTVRSRSPVASGLKTMLAPATGAVEAPESLSELLLDRAAQAPDLFETRSAAPLSQNELKQARASAIASFSSSEGRPSPNPTDGAGMQVKPYLGPDRLFDGLTRQYSYSSLQSAFKNLGSPQGEPAPGNERPEDVRTQHTEAAWLEREEVAPDRDEAGGVERTVSDAAAGSTSDSNAPPDRFNLPGGAAMGTLIHNMFEDPLFQFDAPLKEPAEREWIRGHLAREGVDLRYESVFEEMIRDLRGLSCNGLQLCLVSAAEQIRELQFHLSSAKLSIDPLIRAIRAEQVAPPPKPLRLSIGADAHYLSGFIDLVVRQNGRYFILDYKSNLLGSRINDYTQENLRSAIRSSLYDLQYHLYIVALFRYLRQVDPGFDPKSQFGGVFYLFLRGLNPDGSSGVWFDNPDPDTILKLESIIQNDHGA